MATRRQRATERAKTKAEVKPRSHGPQRGKELWSCEGDGWIYRKPNFDGRRWRVRRRHLATGRLESIKLEAQSLSEAKIETQQLADDERASGADPEKVEPSTEAPTVAVALQAWLKTLDARARTLKAYGTDAALYQKVLGQRRLVGELVFDDVEKLFTVGQWSTRKGRTKMYHRARLSLFFQWCMKHGHVRRDLAALVAVPKVWRESAREGREDTAQALTLAEQRKLLRAAREPALVNFRPATGSTVAEVYPPRGLWLFLFLSLRTALRLSNLIGSPEKPPLRWSNIDLATGILSIPKRDMKGKRAYRAPLHQEVIAVLKTLRADLGRVPDPAEAVIADCPQDVRKALQSALVRAGLADQRTGVFLGTLADTDNPRSLRIHDLRHAAISLWASEMPGGVYAKLADHKATDVPDVTQRYDHHQEVEGMRKWLNKVPTLLDRRSLEDIDRVVSAV